MAEEIKNQGQQENEYAPASRFFAASSLSLSLA